MTDQIAVTKEAEAQIAAIFGVRPRVDDGGVMGFTKRESMQVKYWKKPDGWVTIGPTRTSDGPGYLRYLEGKRYKPLPDSYGVEVAGNGTMQVRDGTKQLQRFIAAGGLTAIDERGDFGPAGEPLLPRDQIIALGMHRKPGVVEARPDLADHKDVECRYAGCTQPDGNRRLFTSEQAREQHISVAHKEAVASEAVGQALATALEGQRGNTSFDPQMIASIVAATVAAMSGAQQTAVASVAPVVSDAPEEEMPEAYRMEVERAAQRAEGMNYAGDKFDSWNRADFMKYAKEINMPFPERHLRVREPEWRALVRQYVAEHPQDEAA